ncbi:MAG: bifunctional diaminohydroxyphosphoribosylaminopyrimidine deaminase/5-amino-6-(5-phosphoribosylamino)uracil reductase RibD [Myxococcota bacterium]
MTDADFMDLAIEQARAAIGRTSPNPPVGALLVREGRVVAQGHTEPPGGPHAEIVALREAGEAAQGATLYVTLEPCCHHGRTAPCSESVIASGVSRVVVGCRDENPLVSGKGIEAIRSAGIDVTVGVRGEVCREMAAPFFTWVTKHRPYVVLKAAATLDGRMATRTGDSRWITGEEARARVHRWRDRFDAVLVGAGTVRADDPALTTRLPDGKGRDPVRVVLDGLLSTSPSARVYRQQSEAPTWLVTGEAAEPERLAPFVERRESKGARVEALQLRAEQGSIRISDLLNELARRGVVSLLVEGGAVVHGSFLASGLVDEIRLFIAPKLLGNGPSWLSLGAQVAPDRVSEALELERPKVEVVGEDLLLSMRLAVLPKAPVA